MAKKSSKKNVKKISEQVDESELQGIVRVSTSLRRAKSRSDMQAVILNELMDIINVGSALIALRDPINGSSVIELALGNWNRLTNINLPEKAGICGLVISTGEIYISDDVRDDPRLVHKDLIDRDFVVVGVPLIAQDQTIGMLAIGRETSFTPSDIHLATAVADIAAIALYQIQIDEQSVRSSELLKSVNKITRRLVETLDIQLIYEHLDSELHVLFPNLSAILISFCDLKRNKITLSYGSFNRNLIDISQIPPFTYQTSDNDPYFDLTQNQTPLIINDLSVQTFSERLSWLFEELIPESALLAPMISKGQVMGVLELYGLEKNQFSPTDIEIIDLISNAAGITIENAQLFTQTQHRLERLTALRTIDMAINALLDLRVTLNILLEQIVTHLQIDAADVLLVNSSTWMLEYAAHFAFHGSLVTRTQIRLGEGLAGKAALERKIISIPNISSSEIDTPRSSMFADEGFMAYWAAPLIAKGEVKGVLEIYQRRSVDPDPEWFDFLETLAGQAAIAIDNATLFNNLQRMNMELVLAYDTTLEGWSHALDLRDRDTEGHTRRVADMCIKLAQDMGLSDTELINIRRGALLHDIGKMGIPDNILHKPGPLTNEEKEIMYKHPTYAHEMLSEINFLKPALDIPLYHHEKWDGTGYPHGLSGEEIPLSARIFAVVDVWDSLSSDRPYREAWPVEDVKSHIREQSGKSFDPQVVDVFFQLDF
jgi:putative nucleotidyltransferase with HDIG domain